MAWGGVTGIVPLIPKKVRSHPVVSHRCNMMITIYGFAWGYTPGFIYILYSVFPRSGKHLFLRFHQGPKGSRGSRAYHHIILVSPRSGKQFFSRSHQGPMGSHGSRAYHQLSSYTRAFVCFDWCLRPCPRCYCVLIGWRVKSDVTWPSNKAR